MSETDPVTSELRDSYIYPLRDTYEIPPNESQNGQLRVRKVLAHAVGYLGYQSGILEVMSIAEFKLAAPFKPTGDQPQAIRKLVEWFKKGFQYQTLLGVHVRARMTLTQNHHS